MTKHGHLEVLEMKKKKPSTYQKFYSLVYSDYKFIFSSDHRPMNLPFGFSFA